MPEGWVNTLMAGTYKARSVRGRYSQAGYVRDEERPMYIADVPAGSRQDELRDYNRAGYRSARPWNDAPAYDAGEAYEAALEAPVLQFSTAARRKPRARRSFLDRLAAQAKRESGDVVACAVFLIAIMVMTAAWGQAMIRGVEIQRSINAYQANTVAFERENEQLEQQLEQARGGERIRNLAQNELGMLRPERAQTETIYIQAPAAQKETVQNTGEPRMEVLDILLGLLNVFHIGE